MKDWQSQSHVRSECKYHVVILPKYRKKLLYGRLRRQIGGIFHQLCRQKHLELVEGKAMPDHVHMLLSVPPRYSIAMTVGFLKGKSAVRIHRDCLHAAGSLYGRSFWARGYCVSTVVPRPRYSVGYSFFSLIRASAVVNRQLMPALISFRERSQAAMLVANRFMLLK